MTLADSVRLHLRRLVISSTLRRRSHQGVFPVEIRSTVGMGAKLEWCLEIMAYCDQRSLMPQFRFSYPDSGSSEDYFSPFFSIKEYSGKPPSFVKIASIVELATSPIVVAVNKIDRSDAEFEAFLLEVLSDFQVSVPELGTLTAVHRPLVFLTSNNTRELSEALKRRCLYLFIDYPSIEQELSVVRIKVPELAPKLARQAVELVQSLRSMDLRKSPSISETLDWAKALTLLNATHLDEETVNDTLNTILKYEGDIRKAQDELKDYLQKQKAKVGAAKGDAEKDLLH